LIFFITLERSKTRQDKFESILETIKSVVFSPFVKAEADLVECFVLLFETVCASSLAMCAYQLSEHLHLTFADHLDKQIPVFGFRQSRCHFFLNE
jgi:hypothetical protein